MPSVASEDDSYTIAIIPMYAIDVKWAKRTE